jgi:hypothetical protein
MPLQWLPDTRPADCRCRTKPATPGPSRRALGSVQLAESRASERSQDQSSCVGMSRPAIGESRVSADLGQETSRRAKAGLAIRRAACGGSCTPPKKSGCFGPTVTSRRPASRRGRGPRSWRVASLVPIWARALVSCRHRYAGLLSRCGASGSAESCADSLQLAGAIVREARTRDKSVGSRPEGRGGTGQVQSRCGRRAARRA